VLRTVNAQPTLWEALLPEACLGLPAELEAVDRLLDDPVLGGMSHAEIGRRLGRSSRWAALAIASAQRREASSARDPGDIFDGSTLALRKYTSSELLDHGFNMSVVAERQGHSPQVLAKHYSKARRSADRKAAEHLDRLINQLGHPNAESPGPSL
jgi:hypothetical protein